MDIEALRTFVEVADAGGVTAAASRLGVSKSIVSRRLGRMEAELGVQLLARSTRGQLSPKRASPFVITPPKSARNMMSPWKRSCRRATCAEVLELRPH
ncbi:LysR family transcriptional regulator [Sphingobium sp. HWE2-09]|uniref:LysR family transcriptional regulator n=1 Tax=Sphingobium sp. HWE2-09 TaxID=3108390 RepID=UPI00403E768F